MSVRHRPGRPSPWYVEYFDRRRRKSRSFKAQMGHASISITCDVYGRWLENRDTKTNRMDSILAPSISIPARTPAKATT